MQPKLERDSNDVYARPAAELCVVLQREGFRLSNTLIEMLDEHYSHRTERRGCGFTQASRHVAVFVNRPRAQHLDTIADLFPRLRRRTSWPATGLPTDETEPVPESLDQEAALAELRRVLDNLPGLLKLPESRLLAAIIADLVSPLAPGAGPSELPPYVETLAVGTCPLAEKYFLELSCRFVRRRGRANVLVSDSGSPLLIEKLHMGDSHSCISVAPLVLNGVRLPPGCLFAVKRDEDVALRSNRNLPGSIIPVSHCTGFRFLRLTTLSVAPGDRARAFTAHFQSQVDAGLFAPGEATIEQLRTIALEQI